MAEKKIKQEFKPIKMEDQPSLKFMPLIKRKKQVVTSDDLDVDLSYKRGEALTFLKNNAEPEDLEDFAKQLERRLKSRRRKTILMKCSKCGGVVRMYENVLGRPSLCCNPRGLEGGAIYKRMSKKEIEEHLEREAKIMEKVNKELDDQQKAAHSAWLARVQSGEFD